MLKRASVMHDTALLHQIELINSKNQHIENSVKFENCSIHIDFCYETN